MLTKKTKIICTMGPATDDDEVLKDLMRSGMDIARLNFSHGDHEEQLGRIKRIKKFREELNLPIAILLDTKGPEIRTGLLETDDDVELVTGQEYTLTTRDIKGNNEITSITYAELPQDVEAGNTILIDDGLIELKGGFSIPTRVTFYARHLLKSAYKEKSTTSNEVVLFGDPCGNRTHVNGVRGRCLNRLTNGP